MTKSLSTTTLQDQTTKQILFANGCTWELKVNRKTFEIIKYNTQNFSPTEPLLAESLINQTDGLINAMASFTPSVS